MIFAIMVKERMMRVTRYIDAGKLEHYTSCVKLPGSLTEVLVIDTEDYENIPEEDVEPVVYADNLSEIAYCDKLICSNCRIVLEGWYEVEYDDDCDDITHHEYEFNFCPNCGAKLKGE